MRLRVLLPVLLLVSMVLGLSTGCDEVDLDVETLAVSAHTASGATLVGRLTDGHSTQVGFNFWKTDVYLEEQNPAVLTSGEAITGTKSFFYDVGNLQPGTSYSYKAWAKKSDGAKIVGVVVSFTTDSQGGSAVLATLAADNLTSTSATLHGEVVSMGSVSSLNVDFYVGKTSGNLSFAGNVPGDFQAPGVFSVDVIGLDPDTTYYYRAVGSSATGTVVSGEEKSFRTLA